VWQWRAPLGIAGILLILFLREPLEAREDERLLQKTSPQTIPRSTLPRLGWHRSVLGLAKILDELQGDESFAATEHGFLSAVYPDLEIVDLTGLHNPQLAKAGFDPSIVFEAKPTVVWLPDVHYTGMRKKLLDAEAFKRDYEFYPGLFDYGLAIRRDAPRFAKIAQLMEEAKQEVYENPPANENLFAQCLKLGVRKTACEYDEVWQKTLRTSSTIPGSSGSALPPE
jgi:hypothetical protein